MASTKRAKLTDEQIAQAKAVPLIEYLERRGYELVRERAHYVRLKEHSSLIVSLDKNCWFWNSGDTGGDTIDFLVRYEHKHFVDAVIELIQELPADRITPVHRSPAKASVPLSERILPPKNENHARVYAYLTRTRGIAPSIVRQLMANDELYESADHHNAVFVRRVDGIPRYCFMRGTNTFSSSYRGETSWAEKEFAWQRLGTDKRRVYVFEAVIDALSFATLVMRKHAKAWQELTLLTLAGTAPNALRQFLRDNPDAAHCQLVVCLDNDVGGNKGAERIEREYGAEHDVIRLLPSIGKDWNDTLSAYRNGTFKLGGFSYETT